MSAASDYSRLLAEKASLEVKLKLVNAEIAALEPDVLAWFEGQGVDSARLEDGRTLYLRRELWANTATGVPSEVAVKALQSAGLGEFCKPRVMTSQLSAWARELDREGEKVPEALQGIITVREVFKVGHRKGTGKNGEEGNPED